MLYMRLQTYRVQTYTEQTLIPVPPAPEASLPSPTRLQLKANLDFSARQVSSKTDF